MRIKSLRLVNLRVIEEAEFQFNPGFNLIVGVNGVGKSTALDALRICMSRILRSTTVSRANSMSFASSDIRDGLPFLEVELSMTVGNNTFRFKRQQWREDFAADDAENIRRLRREIEDLERPRDRKRTLLRKLDESLSISDIDNFVPSKVKFRNAVNQAAVSPNCIFFSTDRSIVSNARKTKSSTTAGKSTAYAGALISRGLRIAQFSDWIRVQEELAKEGGATKKHLQTMQSAVNTFLPEYDGLRFADNKETGLAINRGRVVLEVQQLSDGERGVLALVLDIARRLSLANPSLNDPLRDGHAIILIDEIDLHLHPAWQRQIVQKLTETFPKCQFVATTHSPQVIGEVKPDCIHIISDGEVYSPTHSFGVDSSRVLEEVMDTDPRTKKVNNLLKEVSGEIHKGRYEKVRELLDELLKYLEDNDPEVTQIRTLLDFMED